MIAQYQVDKLRSKLAGLLDLLPKIMKNGTTSQIE
jgi:hypothetical protein